MQLPPDALTLTNHNGGLALIGPSLTAAQTHFSPHSTSRRSLHITLVSAAEYKLIQRPLPSSLAIPLDHIYVLGLASSRHDRKDVRWLVIIWNHADRWRRTVGLGKKEYHVTLSEDDDYEICKGVASLSNAMKLDEFVTTVERLGEDGLDHTIVACRDQPGLVSQAWKPR